MPAQPQLSFTDTLTRSTRGLTSLNPGHVGMYVCGITPYGETHIGNARVMVTFDVLFRLLRHIYGERGVTYVRNYTDIDDKIVQRAQEVGEAPSELAQRYIDMFEANMQALNVLTPTHQPRVSENLIGIVAMIDRLIRTDYAYVVASGDVMFSVPKFNELGAPHDPFGHLARRTFEADKLQARVETDAEKRDPRDFPLWKANAKSATKLEQAFVPADYRTGAAADPFNAPGRPGWHIECSVMSGSLLAPEPQAGQPLFEIHGGGEDLAFPHHSCEIAQSEAANPGCTLSSLWLHVAFLTVEGQKMSKSLGNFTTINQALQKYSGEAIRLWMLQTHYRKPLDYSDEALQASQNRINRLSRSVEGVAAADALPSAFIRALSDDLNAAKALEVMDSESDLAAKRTMLSFLNLLQPPVISELSGDEHRIFDQRQQARTSKNWSESDRLRDELKAMGILVEDHKDGTTTWRRV